LLAAPAAEWSFPAVSMRAAVMAVGQRMLGFWLFAASDRACCIASFAAAALPSANSARASDRAGGGYQRHDFSDHARGHGVSTKSFTVVP
jgi:hypothetical protein